VPLILHKKRHGNVLALAQVFQQKVQIADVASDALKTDAHALPFPLQVRVCFGNHRLLLLLLHFCKSLL
jgi:hypothetical protein